MMAMNENSILRVFKTFKHICAYFNFKLILQEIREAILS